VSTGVISSITKQNINLIAGSAVKAILTTKARAISVTKSISSTKAIKNTTANPLSGAAIRSAIRFIQVLALSLALSSFALALDEPEFSLSVDSSTGEPSLLLLLSSTEAVDGFNVYRDNQYLSTHRGVHISLPAVAGSYCLVSFTEQTASSPVQYSRCSPAPVVSPADLPAVSDSVTSTAANASAETARERTETSGSVLPTGLFAEVYSGTALELYWDALARPPGQTPRFEIYRDDVLIGETDGTSYWVAGLDPLASYRFRVSAGTGSAAENAALIELVMVQGRYQGSGVVSTDVAAAVNAAGTDNTDASELELRASNPSFTYYSDTVAELFWQHAERAGEISGYRIVRDGVIVGFTSGTSFFQPQLMAGVSYSFDIVTLDGNGVAVADISIDVSNATSASAASSTSASSTDTDAVQSVVAGLDEVDAVEPSTEIASDAIVSDTGSSTLSLSLTASSTTNTIELEEGASTALEIPVTIERQSSAGSTIQLTAQALDDWPGSPLQIELETSELAAGSQRLETLLTVSLPVGRRPLTNHQRRVRISARDAAGNQSASVDVSLQILPVRAADIYLLIGQSNMVGFSRSGTRESFPGGADESLNRIRQLNTTSNNLQDYRGSNAFTDAATITGAPRLIVAEDPLHELRPAFQSTKSGSTIGPGLSFARTILEQTTQEVILVPAAWSGTGFCGNDHGNLGWNSEAVIDPAFAGTQLFDRAMARLALAISESNGVFRGILWHQGEADSNDRVCSSAYQGNLEKLVSAIRSEAALDRRGSAARGADADIPFIVSTMSRGDDERGNFSVFSEFKQRVDQVHRTIASRVPYTAFVNNDDLVPPAYPCGHSSCVHFGAAAYREMGRRYAEQLQQIWQR